MGLGNRFCIILNTPPPILPHAYQNFQKVCVRFNFRTSQDIKFNRSSHATSKKGECKDGHIPTCMLDNKTAIMFSRILTPPHSTRKCLDTKTLEDIGQSLAFVNELYFASPEHMAST